MAAATAGGAAYTATRPTEYRASAQLYFRSPAEDRSITVAAQHLAAEGGGSPELARTVELKEKPDRPVFIVVPFSFVARIGPGAGGVPGLTTEDLDQVSFDYDQSFLPTAVTVSANEPDPSRATDLVTAAANTWVFLQRAYDHDSVRALAREVGSSRPQLAQLVAGLAKEQDSNAAVIARPSIPTSPSNRATLVGALLGAIAGLGVAFIVAMAREAAAKGRPRSSAPKAAAEG